MPRVKQVKQARNDQGPCGKCGTLIVAGMAYRWWKFRYGGRRVRCMAEACAPRGSDLTQSEFLGTLASIEESVSDAISSFNDGGEVDDLVSAIDNAIDELRSLGDDCQSKLDNMPEGLQQGDTGQLLENRAQECEAKADELDSAKSELEQLELIDADDDDERKSFADEQGLEKESEETDDAFEQRVREAIEEENSNRRSEAVEEIEGIDFSID